MTISKADLIPAGRTSLVKKGSVAIQVQTEYAHRPMPRITTTILNSGQVLHKVERNLDQPISSIEEKNEMELVIRKQHTEVIGIIEQNQMELHAVSKNKKSATPEAIKETSTKADSNSAATKPSPFDKDKRSVIERVEEIKGIYRIYCLDGLGEFNNSDAQDEFKELFSDLFKNLSALLTLFASLPGGGGALHETGVYEIERNRLYLISEGAEYYIAYIKQSEPDIQYEKAFKLALTGMQF